MKINYGVFRFSIEPIWFGFYSFRGSSVNSVFYSRESTDQFDLGLTEPTECKHLQQWQR